MCCWLRVPLCSSRLQPHKFILNEETGVTLLPRPAAPPPRMWGRVDAVGGLPAGAPPIPIPRSSKPAAEQAAKK